MCNYTEVRPFHCQTLDIIEAKRSVFDFTQSNLSDVWKCEAVWRL